MELGKAVSFSLASVTSQLGVSFELFGFRRLAQWIPWQRA